MLMLYTTTNTIYNTHISCRMQNKDNNNISYICLHR